MQHCDGCRFALKYPYAGGVYECHFWPPTGNTTMITANPLKYPVVCGDDCCAQGKPKESK